MRCAIKDLAILQEAKDVKIIGPNKVRWRAKLQVLEEYSYNGKNYKKAPMLVGISDKEDILVRGGWVGELDHPMDPSMMRMVNVLYKNASHIFKEIYTEGNVIWGVLENTSNDVGLNLYALITKDKIPVGFSLRALGDIRETNRGQEVFKDIEVITWDCVSNPGFSGCILQEIIDYKHLESFRMNNDLVNLEEYVYGSSHHRREMILESVLSVPMSNVISKIEKKYLFENKNLELQSIKNMLKLKTKKKIYNLL